jgi:hypothetical protein
VFQGALVDAFGVYADPAKSAVLAKIPWDSAARPLTRARNELAPSSGALPERTGYVRLSIDSDGRTSRCCGASSFPSLSWR